MIRPPPRFTLFPYPPLFRSLPAQQAEQTATGEDVLVVREMAVVRLIADVARRRNWNGSEYLSITIRVLVKVDDRKKVSGHAGLVTCPNIESLVPVVAVLIAAFIVI